MYEVDAFGQAPEPLRRALPRDAGLVLALLRETPRGRRAVVTLHGGRRARRRGLSLLLPDLAVEAEENGSPGRETVRGVLPALPSIDDEAEPVAAAGSWWRGLSRLETIWLGENGALLLASLRAGRLAVRGVVEAPADADGLAAAARLLGPRLGLFEPRSVSATVRPFPGASGDAEPAWQLKATELEAARAALAMGYYDAPRRCTMEHIARALGITKSAVFHRIRGLEEKAVKRLAAQYGPLAAEPRRVADEIRAAVLKA